MLWDAIYTAGAALLGGGLQYEGQRQTNEANRDIAREQMAFQREMSNTSWQRGVRDMKEAGINPMLAVSQGGASTPPGAGAQMENPWEGAATTALTATRMKKEIDKMDAEIGAKEQEARLLKNKAITEALGHSAKGANKTFWDWGQQIIESTINNAVEGDKKFYKNIDRIKMKKMDKPVPTGRMR